MIFRKKSKKTVLITWITSTLWYIYLMAALDRQSLPFCGGGKSGLHRAGSPFQRNGYSERERRMLRTISRRKESATEKKPPGFIPVRVKRRGKSPPGGRRKLHRTGKPLPQQDQIGDELLLAALQVPGSGRTDRWLPPCSPEQGTESGLSQMLLFWEKFYRGKIYE